LGRPRHDDARLGRAVADLQKTFRIDRYEAEDQVIATMLDADDPRKNTARWRRSMRARLR
jgi:hypothetical protein